MNKPRLLLVDNDKLTQKSLHELLCRFGYNVEIANSLKESLEHLKSNLYQVVLAGTNPKELLTAIKKKDYPSQVVVLTSYRDVKLAVESIKMGAFDYLVRPVDDEKLILSLQQAVIKAQIHKPKPIPTKRISNNKNTAYHGLVGKSPKIANIYSLIERVSNAKATVLVRGESGTGKRMVAQAIHQADKKRRDKPFIEIACGTLSRGLIESELFGHAKGSFTDAISDRKGRFELAHGGSILLDDIDALSPDLQVKLLRVLQHKEFERLGDHRTIKVDVRIIVATNHDLERAVEEGRFREDLYYRLNVISINIPPLRQRREDMPHLIEHFIKLYADENSKQIKEISNEVLQILTSYNWPGNIRELENIIERAVILDTDGVIAKNDLPEIIFSQSEAFHPELSLETSALGSVSLKDALKEPEKVYILKVLKAVGWNKKKAASKLGVNRTTLYNKLRKYNINFSQK